MRFKAILILLLLSMYVFAQEDTKSVEDQRRDTVRYGTDTEIIELIEILKKEKASYLDEELIKLLETTKSDKILAGGFSFFSEEPKPGLENLGLKLLEAWDREYGDALTTVMDYLGKMKEERATDSLKDILDAEEKRYSSGALRALGRIASEEPKESREALAEYLITYYKDRDPPDGVKQELILALGEIQADGAVDFLSELVSDEDTGLVRRIAALEALRKIGHEDGLAAVLGALSAKDANVRAAAVEALGPFSGKETEEAIVEAFRDSFYKTRIAAAKAAAQRGLEEAVPFLQYRAERDGVAVVKETAVEALGTLTVEKGSPKAREALSVLFTDPKGNDRIRILAAEKLLVLDASQYAKPILAELDMAKEKKRNILYDGLAKALSTAKSAELESLAARFLQEGTVVEKLYGLQMAQNNGFRSLVEKIQSLAEDKNASIARSAKETLEKLRVEIEE